jgi:hypothetical protein
MRLLLLRLAAQPDDAALFAHRAARLKAAYSPAFFNPATGVLDGWRSADRQLHL